MINSKTIDRLKSQLLTSGLSQQNQALFQVINLLIDAVRQSLVVTNTLDNSGGGSLLSESFVTINNEQGSLINSRKIIPGTGISFNIDGQRLVISAVIPFGIDGKDGIDGLMGPPGIRGPQGIQGLQGIQGPVGSASNVPFGLEYEQPDEYEQILVAPNTYQEGIWTPNLLFGGLQVGMTFSNQVGQFVKIGNFIALTGIIALSAKGTSIGAATITALPFPFTNGDGFITSTKISYNNFTAGVTQVGLQFSGSGNLIPVRDEFGVNTQLTDADFTNTSSLVMYFCYLK